VSLWTEVADRVYRRRYNPLDVSVCVVRGPTGLMVVDTRSTHREADQIRADLAELGDLPVRWVVNTHAHYDHTFGNARFGPGSDVDAPIYAHERVPAHLDEFERPMLADWVAQEMEPVAEWREVVIMPPTVLLGERAIIDVGDRIVETRHLGRGHTDNDIVLHIPDAGAWLVGDLVEESGPPCFGSGSFPLDWPDTMVRVHEVIGAAEVVVPGHGAVVDANFVAAQQVELLDTAELIRELFTAGVLVEDAVAAGGRRWPFPSEGMAGAVRDGYRQLAAGT
jgi:glyoxylase-like metal-dependent hydrolase (beta-lactamase superfamily II)